MGKARKHSRGRPSGFVPDYMQAVEPDEFVYSERMNSEASPPLKRRRFGLNGDNNGVSKEVLSLSKMSRSERKNLVHKLKMELQQVRDLSKKIASFSSDTVLLSPYNDHSCSDGPRRPPPENFATFVGSQGKKRPPVRSDKQRNKKGPSRLNVPTSYTVASVMKECETLLNRLWSHKSGWPFRTPVDPVMLNIPDYFNVIKHPMDLGTIRSRLCKGEYSSPLDFAADVRLTFSNSIAYNPPGNQFHTMAQGISKYFESGWKSIEKKIPMSKPPVIPLTSSASLESEIPFEVAPMRKKEAAMNDNKLRVEPAKLVMTDGEKKKLGQDLMALEEDFPQKIADLLREQSGSDGQSGEGEIEIDIEALSDEILFMVRKLLDDYLREKKKSMEKSEPCEMEIVHDSGFSNSPLQPSKGDLQIDEDVDIVGGNDPSVSSHPPLKIEKDAACRNNESSSSSSSSSESGSSSSDSDSCSSSGSETDSIKASKPTSREEKKQPGVGIDKKEDDSNSEKIVVNDSLNELDQLEHTVGEKSTTMDAVVLVPDEETAPPERQISPDSPDKRYRAAFLKNRFADTIMKAREKAFTKGEKGDPEKLRIEREEFEKRLREEKERLQAEAKAAEEARRKAKAEAAEKARREREQEREAARQALQKMEKTVEINEGIRFMEDLQMLRATGTEGDQLPTSMEVMSPKFSEDMLGLGSFKMESNSNPLEHLGLYMKMDEDEDEEEDPPHFSQRKVEDNPFDRSEKQEHSPHRVEGEDQLVSGNEEPVSQEAHDNGDQEDGKPINPNEIERQLENMPEQESGVGDKEEQETEVVDMRKQENEVVDMGVEEVHPLDRSEGRTLSPHRKEREDPRASGNEESVSEKAQDYENQRDEKINQSEREEQLENVLEQESSRDDDTGEHDQSDSSSRLRSVPAKKVASTSKLHVSSPKSGRLNATQLTVEDNAEASRETWDGTSPISSSNAGARMSHIIQKRCKIVISKLQRRIDKEGQQIVPMLTNLWKRIQNGYAAGGVNNLLELREIDHRVERLEYAGVMELASDVQLMLRGAMQFYGFSHEVRSEAKKVHNLFFDLLKMSFPDTDFREARNALSFSGSAPTLVSTPTPRGAGISQGKRQKLVNEPETEPSSPQRSQQRENSRIRVQIPQKETKLGGTTSHTDESPILAHPGELVICKKKRKDREKSGPKTRTGGSSSPVSPPPAMIGRGLRSPVSGGVPRETRLAQQQRWPNQPTHPNNSGAAGDSVGWANPVKRLRTDSGKRRPSHL